MIISGQWFEFQMAWNFFLFFFKGFFCLFFFSSSQNWSNSVWKGGWYKESKTKYYLFLTVFFLLMRKPVASPSLGVFKATWLWETWSSVRWPCPWQECWTWVFKVPSNTICDSMIFFLKIIEEFHTVTDDFQAACWTSSVTMSTIHSFVNNSTASPGGHVFFYCNTL